MDNKHYDISQLCAMLNTTSRTLRFYEQKGLIQSIRDNNSGRRQYTEEQISLIKNILVLRKLGLSIKRIQQLQKHDEELQSALYEKRAEIGALIHTKLHEMALIDQALEQIRSCDNIDRLQTELKTVHQHPEFLHIARICNDAIINGKTDILYQYFCDTMKDYMPPSAYERMREDTLKPLGSFQCIEHFEVDQTYPNVLHQYIRYEYLGLKIRYVFIDCKIHGLWLGYYEL